MSGLAIRARRTAAPVEPRRPVVQSTAALTLDLRDACTGVIGSVPCDATLVAPELVVSRQRQAPNAIQVFRPQGRVYAVAQRTVDLAVGIVLLALTLPLMALLALVIRVDSGGPAVFKQRRLGRDGRLFWFYKFRTMYVDARDRCPELYQYDFSDDEVESMQFKLPYDPRNTRVGRWLRRTSLDELPNLINVLRGDLSLVGPRPEIPEMLQYYRWEQLPKLEVRPGVTGLAQVSGRNILKFQQTIAADLEYVATRSFWLDIKILVKTVWTVAMRVGAL